MKTFSLSIFWKFLLALVLIVAIFGSLTIYVVDHEVNLLLEKEFDQKGQYISRTIAGRASDLLQQADGNALSDMIINAAKIDTTIAYIIVKDTENHLFSRYISPVLSASEFSTNQLPSESTLDIVPEVFNISSDRIVKNFKTTFGQGKRWSLYIGLIEQDLINKSLIIKKLFVIIVIAFLTMGILGAFVFSYTIAQPLKKMGARAYTLSLEFLNQTDSKEFLSRRTFRPFGSKFKILDEIDFLAEQFNGMINRLRISNTELKKVQSSLSHIDKMSAIGTLVAGICHNMNNPIAGLKNCIKRISKNPGNVEQIKKYLPMMAEATDNAEGVLKELLAFSRREEVKYEYFDIRKSVESVIFVLSSTLEDYKISFTKKYDQNLLNIYGNKNQIGQVILNIVKNGIDSICDRIDDGNEKMGEIIFQIEIQNDMLKLDISDNGMGINPDNLAHIFDPFFTTKKKVEGTGLGLSVSYNIIKAHKGDIYAIENKLGGLTLTIEIPLNTSNN